MTQIPVPFGRDISFAGLREWIYAFSSRGFHIQQVSYDGYQSEESRQILEEKGYHTEYVSVDKSTDPYDTLIEQMLNPGRLDYYNYPIFILEMEELKLVNGTRYDHPKKTRFGKIGSKDVADAVAGSVYSAISYALENPSVAAPNIRIHRPNKWFQPNYGDRNTY
jgi:phage terminase large subunit-like protein